MTLTPSRRRRHGLRLLATTAVATLVLLPTAANAAVPVPSVHLPSAIEGFAKYQKQTTCSPTPKPGTVKLKNLLLKTYPGTRSLGISRACSAGGTSEHKEGRAFDWGVRYSNTAERAKAQAFLTWLLKTDSAGHKAANARRLGVMYVIWNRHIWGAYAAGSGWRPYGGSNPHTDHVHISLSWAGARGTTSFWTGKINATGTTVGTGTARPGDWGTPTAPKPVAPPAILPAPHPATTLPTGAPLEDESVTVTPNRYGTFTQAALVQGQHYRVEVRGTWKWNASSSSLADAECSTTNGSDWSRQRWLANASGDQLGLYLDGHDLDLYTYGGGGCATASHTYVAMLTPTRSGRVPLKLWEPAPATGYADNSGSVRVRIIHDVARDTLPVTVDTHERWGTTTPGSVVAGQQYTVTATGTWSPAAGTTADAACIDTDGGQIVQRDQWGNRVWRLSVNGTSMKATCRPDHTYSWTWTANQSGPVVVRIDSDGYDTHTGTLAVVLTKVTDGGSGGTPTA